MKSNSPKLWQDLLLTPEKDTHKYKRGHALIYGAPDITGATRLAAESCARVGAGMVTVLGGARADIFRVALPPHIIVRDDLEWDDKHVTAKLYGSGGLAVTPDFDRSIPVILDADALAALPTTLYPNYILTPHEGEFSKAFPDITGEKYEKAQMAARAKNCIVVLKGAETVIAHPDGRAVINDHASPYLATAGTGDVLAGMITGLCAQGIDPFQAACAAVWIHGEAGRCIGPGLVSSDIQERIPEILRNFT